MTDAMRTLPPIFNTPVRWALRVLAWSAFGVAAYLAWHAVHQSSVAGCTLGGQNACDEVLASSWSKWLGIPIAVVGLAWYAALAALSVLLGLQNARASGWVATVFVMLSTVAAGASVWFLGTQAFAVGTFCPFCVVVDLCGIALGVLALGAVIRWSYIYGSVADGYSSEANLMALRSALPVASGARRAPAVPPSQPRKLSLPIAFGMAATTLAALIVGQLFFPAPTFSLQDATLDQSMDLAGSNGATRDLGDPSAAGPHVAMRVASEPSDEAAEDDAEADLFPGEESDSEAPAEEDSIDGPQASESREDDMEIASPPDDVPRPHREVKLLGGKLTLDVYKHPLLGSPEAPHMIVEMVSYDCPHCRKMHRTVERARSRYGDQLAIIVMPIPLERECNKFVAAGAESHAGACATARMALGVAAIRPQVFEKLHHWLMADKEKPPTIEKTVIKAYEMVNSDRLRELTRSEAIRKQLDEYVNLFATLRNQHKAGKDFGLPVQILGDKVMSGIVENESDLIEAWEEHLGIVPR